MSRERPGLDRQWDQNIHKQVRMSSQAIIEQPSAKDLLCTNKMLLLEISRWSRVNDVCKHLLFSPLLECFYITDCI